MKARLLGFAIAAAACASLFVVFSETAYAGQNEISGFRYATCSEGKCFEVIAEKAWLSQVNGGFSTGGSTRVLLRARNGTIERELNGQDATYSPTLQIITMDLDQGVVALISLKDGSVKTLGSPKGDRQ